jgi:hypothetical protein
MSWLLKLRHNVVSCASCLDQVCGLQGDMSEQRIRNPQISGYEGMGFRCSRPRRSNYGASDRRVQVDGMLMETLSVYLGTLGTSVSGRAGRVQSSYRAEPVLPNLRSVCLSGRRCGAWASRRQTSRWRATRRASTASTTSSEVRRRCRKADRTDNGLVIAPWVPPTRVAVCIVTFSTPVCGPAHLSVCLSVRLLEPMGPFSGCLSVHPPFEPVGPGASPVICLAHWFTTDPTRLPRLPRLPSSTHRLDVL